MNTIDQHNNQNVDTHINEELLLLNKIWTVTNDVKKLLSSGDKGILEALKLSCNLLCTLVDNDSFHETVST